MNRRLTYAGNPRRCEDDMRAVHAQHNAEQRMYRDNLEAYEENLVTRKRQLDEAKAKTAAALKSRENIAASLNEMCESCTPLPSSPPPTPPCPHPPTLHLAPSPRRHQEELSRCQSAEDEAKEKVKNIEQEKEELQRKHKEKEREHKDKCQQVSRDHGLQMISARLT